MKRKNISLWIELVGFTSLITFVRTIINIAVFIYIQQFNCSYHVTHYSLNIYFSYKWKFVLLGHLQLLSPSPWTLVTTILSLFSVTLPLLLLLLFFDSTFKCNQYISIGDWFPDPKSCLTLCNTMDWSLPDSSFYGSLQARIPEWVAISFSCQEPR